MGLKDWLQRTWDAATEGGVNNTMNQNSLPVLLQQNVTAPPTPGFDSMGNYIGGTPVGYENSNRLSDSWQKQFGLPNPGGKDSFGPDTSWIDVLMKGLMDPSKGKQAGAAAASAFNPVFASLAAEKVAAQRRGKKNQQDIKGSYKALAQDYVDQAAAEVKGHAKATKEQNKAFAKDTFETRDQYTKVRAESDAEAARLGQTGTSAQQIADQKIGMASAGAVDLQKYQQNMNKAASDQTSKSQSNYMTRGSMIAPQAGAEQLNISKNKLEDVLLGLSREEAQAKLQQTAARLSAQTSASKPDIGSILALDARKQDIIDRYNKVGETIDPSKLKGLSAAYSYGTELAKNPNSGVTADALNKFMASFQGDADINNGTYQDAKSKKQVKLTKEMKNNKLYTFAVQAGLPTAVARQIAEIYTRGV